MFWCIGQKDYGYRHAYRKFPVNNESFVTSSTGRKILYFEADATNSDDPLALDDSLSDLTLEHASQGQRIIEAKYKQSNDVSMHRVFRVFLGNTSVYSLTGSGKKVSVRQRIEKTQEMNVVIDARAAVFTDLLRWCERVTRDMEKREIILSTSDEKYFCTLKVWLKGYGYDVYDVDEEHKMGAEAKENLGIDSGSHDSKGINLDISKDDSEQTENTKHPVSIPKMHSS